MLVGCCLEVVARHGVGADLARGGMVVGAVVAVQAGVERVGVHDEELEDEEEDDHLDEDEVEGGVGGHHEDVVAFHRLVGGRGVAERDVHR